MRIIIDRDRCIGAGMCVLLAPAVFDQDAVDGKVQLLDPAPPPGAQAITLEAEQVCPSGAISVAADGDS
ncbi:ferredoxin [Nocardia brasiliensis]|uniref:ferredoxin n=1 Tax=Nocardia brasiliensis TaxID=37326 RepID=UPI003671D3B3